MNRGMYLVIISAFSMGLWHVCVSAASKEVHPVLGAVIIELTALLIGGLVLLPVLRAGTMTFSLKGIILVMLGGLCVLSADIFALRAYGKGVPISIAGPVMVGGSIVVVSIAGLVLGEKLSLIKALAIIMIIAGSSTLAAISG